MATLTVTPDRIERGELISITGGEFLASTVCTITIPDLGIASEITSDIAGFFGSDDVADHALTTLTLAGNAVADETVVIGAVTYTWKDTPTTVANEVKVGVDAATSIDNLKAAINLADGSGTLYGSLTVVHPTVAAGVDTATTLKLYAKTGGTAGNSLASTETMTQGSFPGATFNSGTPGSAATGVSALLFAAEDIGTYTVTATDGTTTVSTTFQVWS